MNKKVGIILIVLVIIIAISAVVITNKGKVIEENVIANNTTEGENNNIVNKEVTAEERKEIEEYVNKVCNPLVNCKISEFNDINEADKVWIYSHLREDDETSYLTKEQIYTQLEKIFGKNLNLDIDKDIKENKNNRMPEKSETYGVSNKYALPVIDMNRLSFYVIDNVEKKNDEYVVTVIEVNKETDWNADNEGSISSIYTYDENNKVKEVFKISSNELIHTEEKNLLNPAIKEKVLKQKDEFNKYNLVLINEDNNLYVKEIYKQDFANNEVTAEERLSIEKYIKTISSNEIKIEEFDEINDADKSWVYSLLRCNGKEYEIENSDTYLTEDQIKEDLSKIFGPTLNLNVKEDSKSADGYYIPKYDEEKNKYVFLPTDQDICAKYLIDSIQKEGDKYIVNLVEYATWVNMDIEDSDLNLEVFTYDKNVKNKWKKVFNTINDFKDPVRVREEVLNQKEKFNEYKAVLKKDDNNNLYIESFKK